MNNVSKKITIVNLVNQLFSKKIGITVMDASSPEDTNINTHRHKHKCTHKQSNTQSTTRAHTNTHTHNHSHTSLPVNDYFLSYQLGLELCLSQLTHPLLKNNKKIEK